MVILVADVGGTNSRLAVVTDGVVHSVTRYQNAKFASFYDILATYGATTDLSAVQGCCVAVAGPVTSTQAQLTNLNWHFDTVSIAAALPGCKSVRLVNDLAALGYALAALGSDHLTVLKSSGPGETNHQALVVGIGTGFNICLVKGAGADKSPVVIEAELGHASLPQKVWSVLHAEIGTAAGPITNNEHLFSGRGLAGLYQIVSGGHDLGGPEIVAAYDGDITNPATRTIDLTARLLGLLTRELVFQYLPFGGVHFAGGAARGVLGAAGSSAFLGAFDASGPFGTLIGQVPVKVITEDTAALLGLAHYAGKTE